MTVIVQVTWELLKSFKRTWYTCQSRWPRRTDQEPRVFQNRGVCACGQAYPSCPFLTPVLPFVPAPFFALPDPSQVRKTPLHALSFVRFLQERLLRWLACFSFRATRGLVLRLVTRSSPRTSAPDRPRSIYQYSNIVPRLLGQTFIFGVVSFVSKSLLGIERQKKLLKRCPDNTFTTSVYRKKTFTGLYTKWDSFTPRKYKINLIRTLTYRCFRICSSPSLLQAAIKDLRKLLLQNGHPQGVITYNINDVLNKNGNKPNNPVPAKVPKKDILILLPYLGLK